jgi:hypothetical protein
MIWLILSLFFILIYLLIDYYLIKRWITQSRSRINVIFDSFKSFFFIHVIDRLNAAINFEEDLDDIEEGEIK